MRAAGETAPRWAGQPLIALALILGGWVGARAMVWQPPYGPAAGVAGSPATVFPATASASVSAPRLASSPARSALRSPAATSIPARGHSRLSASPVMQFLPVAAGRARPDAAPVLGALPLIPAPSAPAPAPSPTLASASPPSPLPPRAALAATTPLKRWSGDGWLLLRRGGDVGSLAPGLATYGASQTGAVLRYRLDAGPHAITAFVRATAALNGATEQEVAAGLAARPFPAIPLIAAAELRASRLTTGTYARPAVLAIVQPEPAALPWGLTGDAYAAAGYVGGPAATGFVDGQAHLTHRLARVGAVAFIGGGGVWGGAQVGSARLDLGPTAAALLPLGKVGARLALDWRFRVAGDAAPGSGPALTLAAGF